ncbi:DUF6044 family protein [Alteribacillus iranensis]|uniref:YkoS n=1 Tax=Alteribacillus iranensis TaxID=930128 RepID=A0A1I2DQW6_9BACI|nr:DUF6044 family protein [Alteribacillus iranensis]SFE82915.1 hypothetical protein SAMN05192532_104243 [Alteribacillus iranensis]
MKKERFYIFLSIVGIIIYCSPFLFLGEGVHVRLHDHLDSNVIWYKTLVETGTVFAPSHTEIQTMMNGLPRGSLDTAFSLYVLLFSLFEPLTVLVLNEFLMRFIAFFGMFLFLKHHVFKSDHSYILIVAGVSLAFALLPFWPFGGASIAGIPLALYAFLNIRNRCSSFKDWFIITFLPFYSSFVLSFIFFLGLMGVVWLIDWFRTKRSNWQFFSSIAWMTMLFLLKQYRLVMGVLFGQGFVDHRVEFSRGHNSFSRTMELFGENYLTAHTHSYSHHDTLIVYVVLFALLLLAGLRIREWLRPSGQLITFTAVEKALPSLLIVAALFSFWYALWYWEGFRLLKDTIDITNTFNFGRFHLLNAAIWYIVFAISLSVIKKYIPRISWLIAILIAGQLYVVFYENFEWKYSRSDYPSYGEFYAEEQFKEIKDFIDRPPEEYRIVSIGMYPAVAHYNGMYSLDMYVTMYPLSYKHQFREIIEGELEKNESLKDYYNTWGSRVYVFADELGKEYLYTKDKNETIENLDFNTEAFKEMGGEYVLSAVEIENAEENNLELLKVFESESSAWRIHLYEAI